MAVGVLAGQGFEDVEDGVEGVASGDDVVAGEGAIDEPVAEVGRTDGEAAARGFGNGDEDLAGGTGEGTHSRVMSRRRARGARGEDLPIKVPLHFVVTGGFWEM